MAQTPGYLPPNQWGPAQGNNWTATKPVFTINTQNTASFANIDHPMVYAFYIWAVRKDLSSHAVLETLMVDGPFQTAEQAQKVVIDKAPDAATDGFFLDVKRLTLPFAIFEEAVAFLHDLAVFSDYYSSV
jgi:hypothetical protein